jgi:hypothetical protein
MVRINVFNMHKQAPTALTQRIPQRISYVMNHARRMLTQRAVCKLLEIVQSARALASSSERAWADAASARADGGLAEAVRAVPDPFGEPGAAAACMSADEEMALFRDTSAPDPLLRAAHPGPPEPAAPDPPGAPAELRVDPVAALEMELPERPAAAPRAPAISARLPDRHRTLALRYQQCLENLMDIQHAALQAAVREPLSSLQDACILARMVPPMAPARDAAFRRLAEKTANLQRQRGRLLDGEQFVRALLQGLRFAPADVDRYQRHLAEHFRNSMSVLGMQLALLPALLEAAEAGASQPDPAVEDNNKDTAWLHAQLSFDEMQRLRHGIASQSEKSYRGDNDRQLRSWRAAYKELRPAVDRWIARTQTSASTALERLDIEHAAAVRRALQESTQAAEILAQRIQTCRDREVHMELKDDSGEHAHWAGIAATLKQELHDAGLQSLQSELVQYAQAMAEFRGDQLLRASIAQLKSVASAS